MTKRDLKKFLESKHEAAIQAAKDKYYEDREAYLEAMYAELHIPEAAEKIEALAAEIDKVWGAWKLKYGIRSGVHLWSPYHGLDYFINQFSGEKGAALKYISRTEIKFEDDGMKAAHKAYNELLINIDRNYINLIEAVKVCRTAKEAAEYLKQLGFDLSGLETAEAPITALAVQINPKYLFVGGKNAA